MSENSEIDFHDLCDQVEELMIRERHLQDKMHHLERLYGQGRVPQENYQFRLRRLDRQIYDLRQKAAQIWQQIRQFIDKESERRKFAS